MKTYFYHYRPQPGDHSIETMKAYSEHVAVTAMKKENIILVPFQSPLPLPRRHLPNLTHSLLPVLKEPCG